MPGNLYKRGGIWYARFELGGRDIRKSLDTSNLAEAKQRRDEAIRQIKRARFGGERHTWRAAKGKWLTEFAASNVKPSTLTRYKVSLGQLEPFLDHRYQDEITRKLVAEIVSARRAAGVSNATIRRDLTALSSVLRCCVAWEWREDNPAKDYDRGMIKERREPIMLPAEADIDLVVSLAPPGFAAAIRWAQYTGMRQEECAGLERGQVNLQRKAVDLPRTKTGRARSVPLDERAVGTYAGTVAHLKSSFVFWHGEGERYAFVSSGFAALVRRAGALAAAKGQPFRAFRFHDLRHWYAVDYLRRGGGIYDLQKILGHTSIKTTELYLNYLTPDEQGATRKPAQNPAQG